VSSTETLLYGEILVPEPVYNELVHPRGPEVVRERISGSPCWCPSRMEVEASGSGEEELSLPEGNPAGLKELDPGEHEAFFWQWPLASPGETSPLLIDERAGRAVARELGVTVTGTRGSRCGCSEASRRSCRSGTRPERNYVSRLFRPVPLALRQGKIGAGRAGEAGLQHGTSSLDHPRIEAIILHYRL
jgi:predicted nucleic acid-binding protein